MRLDIITKVAASLLTYRGELSYSDIAALPWIEDEDEIALIISALLRDKRVELQQRRVRSASIPDWEDVIVLKSASVRA